jgi:hypothetical protein
MSTGLLTRALPLALLLGFAIASGAMAAQPAWQVAPEDWQFPVVEPFPVVDQFLWPVGDPFDYTRPATGEERGFSLIRGLRNGRRRHQGVDLSNQRHSSFVRAPAPGVVLEAGWHGAWGNLVVIAHRLPGGEMVASLMSHLRSRSIQVKRGERVVAGQVVGKVGSTGRATGPHLHLEIRRLGHVDPMTTAWNNAPVLNPLTVFEVNLADAMVPNQGLPEHWGWSYIADVSGTSPRGFGDPDALLSRREFYTWTARATGAEVSAHSGPDRVRSRLALLGLSEHLSGITSVQATMDASEAAEALGMLSARGWIRTVSRERSVGSRALEEHGLAGYSTLLTSSEPPQERVRRPLTRAEGALLIKAAQSMASPATAMH